MVFLRLATKYNMLTIKTKPPRDPEIAKIVVFLSSVALGMVTLRSSVVVVPVVLTVVDEMVVDETVVVDTLVVIVVVFAPVVFVVLSPIVTSVSYIVISLLLLLDPLPQSHLHSPAPPHNVVDPSLESL